MWQRLHDIINALPGSWVSSRREAQLWTWSEPHHFIESLGSEQPFIQVAPFTAAAIVRAFLPAKLGGKVAGFTASGSIIAGLDERSAKNRAGLVVRCRVMLTECKLYIHVLLILVTGGGVAYSLVRSLLLYFDNSLDWERVCVR